MCILWKYNMYLSIENLCSVVNTCFSWHKQWCGWTVKERISLTFYISFLYSIFDFFKIKFGLNINMFSSFNWLGWSRSQLISGSFSSKDTPPCFRLPLNFDRIRLYCLKWWRLFIKMLCSDLNLNLKFAARLCAHYTSCWKRIPYALFYQFLRKPNRKFASFCCSQL